MYSRCSGVAAGFRADLEAPAGAAARGDGRWQRVDPLVTTENARPLVPARADAYQWEESHRVEADAWRDCGIEAQVIRGGMRRRHICGGYSHWQ
jgi:hypothetical protein